VPIDESDLLELTEGDGITLVPDLVAKTLTVSLYTALTASLSCTPSIVEVGATVDDVALAWSYNKAAVVSQSIDQGIGSLDVALRSLDLHSLGLTSAKSWTLTGNDGKANATSVAGVGFQHKRRYGVSATATPDQALLEGLSSEFATSLAQSKTMDASNQYLYFAWPAAFGEPVFTVGGFIVTGWVKTVVSFTNAQGYATDFWVYRSQYLQNASDISVVVAPA
jgi:hypothetical protein